MGRYPRGNNRNRSTIQNELLRCCARDGSVAIGACCQALRGLRTKSKERRRPVFTHSNKVDDVPKLSAWHYAWLPCSPFALTQHILIHSDALRQIDVPPVLTLGYNSIPTNSRCYAMTFRLRFA
eukprot:scaffold316_cov122-Skeletonema_dohrnii-CCMP3373.AAC.9